MRKLLFLFIAVLAFSCSSDDGGNTTNPEVTNPEPVDCVYTGNVSLKTQDEVNAFAAYGYCEIKGDLIIGDYISEPAPTLESEPSDIISLAGLASLKRVSGVLYVINNPVLANMEGLHNISDVGLRIMIDKNDAFLNLNGLTSLSILGSANDDFDSLSIHNNKSLVNFEGIGPVAEVGYISIENNPELISIEALKNIHSAKEGIGIVYNASLLNLKGLEGITEAGSIGIYQNLSLLSIEGLRNIKYTVGSLFILRNPVLTSLSPLSGITAVHKGYSVTAMMIDSNAALTSLDGLQNITEIDGEILIQSNTNLKNLCAISNLVINGPYVNVAGNFYNPNKQAFIAGKCSVL